MLPMQAGKSHWSFQFTATTKWALCIGIINVILALALQHALRLGEFTSAIVGGQIQVVLLVLPVQVLSSQDRFLIVRIKLTTRPVCPLDRNLQLESYLRGPFRH